MDLAFYAHDMAWKAADDYWGKLYKAQSPGYWKDYYYNKWKAAYVTANNQLYSRLKGLPELKDLGNGKDTWNRTRDIPKPIWWRLDFRFRTMTALEHGWFPAPPK